MTRTYPEAVEVLPPDADREEWLKLRREGIGGSDALAVLGLNPYSSRLSVYLDKLGQIPDTAPSERMRWGQRLEPVIREWFEDTTGITVHRAGLTRNLHRPWQQYSPDGITDDDGIWEGKTTSIWRTDDWADDEVPDHAEAQVQHGMAVTGYDHAYIVGKYDVGLDPVVRCVLRDEDMIAAMTEIQERFWRDYVLTRTPPPLDGLPGTTDLLKRLYPRARDRKVTLPDSALADKQAVLTLDAQIKQLDLLREEHLNRLRDALRDHTAGIHPSCRRKDQAVVTWRNTGKFSVSRFTADHPEIAAAYRIAVETLDLTALSQDHPELYADYRARVLRLTQEETEGRNV